MDPLMMDISKEYETSKAWAYNIPVILMLFFGYFLVTKGCLFSNEAYLTLPSVYERVVTLIIVDKYKIFRDLAEDHFVCETLSFFYPR